MKYTTAVLALLAGANAHTLMSEIYVDGKGQGDGTCVRQPSNPVGAVDPITDLSSTDMVCGQNGLTAVERVCSVSGGSSLSFEYRQWPDDVSKGPLDDGHAGPCSVYLKKVDNAAEATGEGNGWFKLWDDGYDESSGQWCTQKMINNNQGRITVTIPDSLQGGDYLVRPELLALHNVRQGIPEFYVGCAQVFLESSGSATPGSTVSIPGHVSPSDEATTFDIYNQPMQLPYSLPGPDVVQLTNPMGDSRVVTSQEQTNGLPIEGCILTNANWCAVEIPDFSDEQGCWDADSDCWDQLDVCYDSAPPTGSANCKIWEQKCRDNQSLCRTSNPSGPVNKGQSLQPDVDTISVPAAVNANINYGVSSNGGSDNSGSDNSPAATTPVATTPATSVAPAATSGAKNSDSDDSDNTDTTDDSDDEEATDSVPPPSYEDSDDEDSDDDADDSTPQQDSTSTTSASTPPPVTTTFATQVTQAPSPDVHVETEVAYVTEQVYVTVAPNAPAATPTEESSSGNRRYRNRHWRNRHSDW